MTTQECYDKWIAIGWFLVTSGIILIGTGIWFIISISNWYRNLTS